VEVINKYKRCSQFRFLQRSATFTSWLCPGHTGSYLCVTATTVVRENVNQSSPHSRIAFWFFSAMLCVCGPSHIPSVEALPIAIEEGVPPLETLTMLTYNVGLLRFRMFGAVVFANPPHASERLPHIPKALRSYPADILAIQECYKVKHANYLCNELKDLYPYHARAESGGIFQFHNGLLVLSKYPIVRCELQRYEKVSTLEYLLATKSSLIVEVQLPGMGRVTIVNMHTTAGGHVDPEHPDVDGDREDELRQAAEVCETAAAEDRLGLIIGDLNCGPEASASNYSYILKRGFRDTYAEAAEAGKLDDGPAFTWDPTNYLNASGPHKTGPGQRCDHVLLPSKGMEGWRVDKARVVLGEKLADIGGGKLSTLSDHHGVLVVLKRDLIK
jgi:endonuclease/exonuclease/phosphatase family metal-dependent hydrolase